MRGHFMTPFGFIVRVMPFRRLWAMVHELLFGFIQKAGTMVI